jgi:hypothetical protein
MQTVVCINTQHEKQWPTKNVATEGGNGLLPVEMQSRLVKIALSVLTLLPPFLTGAGLLLAAAVKTDTLADFILTHDPRYSVAMRGLDTLQDMKYSFPPPENSIKAGIISIDDPEWGVMLAFIESETAIRKSERNEPSAPNAMAAPPTSQNSAAPAPPVPAANSLPDINFDRIKTIVSFRMDIATIGPTPIVPPYRLMVFWPNQPAIGRRVYEFMSFREFRLDLRHFLLDEIEGWSLWMAVISFGVTALTDVTHRIIAAIEPSEASAQTAIDM